MSKTTRLIVLVTFAVLAASVVSRFATTNSHADFLGNLTASVGPGFEIQLKTDQGALVTQVAAGTYGIHVNDNASNGFHYAICHLNLQLITLFSQRENLNRFKITIRSELRRRQRCPKSRW